MAIEPLIVEISTDLSPVDFYEKLCVNGDGALLESSMTHDVLGRYSFVAWDAFFKFRHRPGEGDPYTALEAILKTYPVSHKTEFPFMGGGIGYFSYDLVWEFLKVKSSCEAVLEVPTVCFDFYEKILIFEHHTQRVFLSVLGITQPQQEAVEKFLVQLEQISSDIPHFPCHNEDIKPKVFSSPFTKQTYMDTVESVRQYIRAGDIYIANLTHTFQTDTSESPLAIYERLRRISPAPFSGLLNFEGFSLISSSPERFLKIQQGCVETRPIKGTRPRGLTPERDEMNKLELIHSEKDQSELLMIVDLERNDLSKVCKPHSVRVERLFELETYATVYHLSATVKGQLMQEVSGLECIRACFPGGSITGTPKLRAMEIIDELEMNQRNVYTGCMGYLGFDGGVDLNIVIRSIVIKDEKAYMGVGGGITWESDCGEEYQETLDKARALFESLEGKK